MNITNFNRNYLTFNLKQKFKQNLNMPSVCSSLLLKEDGTSDNMLLKMVAEFIMCFSSII